MIRAIADISFAHSPLLLIIERLKRGLLDRQEENDNWQRARFVRMNRRLIANSLVEQSIAREGSVENRACNSRIVVGGRGLAFETWTTRLGRDSGAESLQRTTASCSAKTFVGIVALTRSCLSR